jgi:hypothetical protein
VRRNCCDLDTAVGRMVSLVGRCGQGHLMGVVAYRAPMAATRLSIASGTCPAPALPALRLTSAMVERGARVVGTPLLVWMACLITNASDLWTAPSRSKLKTCAFDRQIEQKSDRRNKTWTVKDSAVLLLAGRERLPFDFPPAANHDMPQPPASTSSTNQIPSSHQITTCTLILIGKGVSFLTVKEIACS